MRIPNRILAKIFDQLTEKNPAHTGSAPLFRKVKSRSNYFGAFCPT